MTTAQCEFIGNDVYYQGNLIKGTDAIGKVCRMLKEQGVETLEGYRGGKLSMTFHVPTRAAQSLTENDKGMKLSKYAPFDFSVLNTGEQS